MTAREVIGKCPDTKVILRDYVSGWVIKREVSDQYMDCEVVKIYGRSHRCGRNFKDDVEIVVMVRANLEKE